METSIDKLIKISLLLLLVLGSLTILAPFAILLIWGIIIAVAVYPMYAKLVNRMGGRKNLVAIIFALIGLAVILIPTILLMGSGATGYQTLSVALHEGTLTIPEPTEAVLSWPVIGEQLYDMWDLAAHNLRAFINKYSDEFKTYGSWILESVASLGLTILQFIISIIIAAILLSRAQIGNETSLKFARRLVGEQAEDFVHLTIGTIRSVVQGILGIALIQSIATAILLIISGIPFAGLWSVIVLILAILQLPPFLVLGPILIYAWSIMGTTAAVFFTIFSILISISDSLLKPIFLGRGVDIPMMVVLLGAIGGMIAFGILGLFVGAVILTLSYKLMIAWINEP